MIQSSREDDDLRLRVVFFRTAAGLRTRWEWLKSLSPAKWTIGKEIRRSNSAFQSGCRLFAGWARTVEVRIALANRAARVIFTVEGDTMVLLHGWIKKTQKTPLTDLRLARERLAQLRGEK
jgi:hypothetical protein